jgi:hypothetical protein
MGKDGKETAFYGLVKDFVLTLVKKALREAF